MFFWLKNNDVTVKTQWAKPDIAASENLENDPSPTDSAAVDTHD